MYLERARANRVFLTSDANKDFFTDLPEKYLPRVLEKYPGEIEKQYVPSNKELWKMENYEAFIRERRRLIAGAINKFLDELLEEARPQENLLELLKMPEGQYLEFKSTLRYDLSAKVVSPSLEKSCLKTICAFLNSEGGVLLIGVSDEGQLIGLSRDYKTLKKSDRDGFENHLINLISSKMGNQYLKFIEISFVTSKDKEICRIKVYRSGSAVFLKEGIMQEFYVRTGNNSRPFSMSEAVEYIREHWK